MRIVKVGLQKTIECGICSSDNEWVRRVEVNGVHAIYCRKCDTLNVFEDIKSKKLREAFKDKVKTIL